MRRVFMPLTSAVALVALAVTAAEPQPAIDASKYLDRALADCGFQRAIDEAAEQGGGRVALPAGTFRLRRGLVLRNNVRLVGAGMDKTVLMPARKVTRLELRADGPQENVVLLTELPGQLDVGSAVVSCRSYPPAWYGSPRPAFVTAIDREAKSVTLAAPYGLKEMKAGEGYLSFGVAAALEKGVRKGDREIHLKNAALFRPGDELALGEPPNESLKAHVFVKQVRGSTLLLEQPARIDFEAWPDAEKLGNKKLNALVWALFPMIHAADVRDCFVADLAVKGHDMDRMRPTQTRYTLSGIHIYNGRRVTLQRVAVRDWPSDGISLQTGSQAIVTECVVDGCLGNGLHPGTGLTDSSFRNNRACRNRVGLYFCWHNRRHVIQDNQFVANREGGITGLGNPGDRDNVIENNRIADSGGPGIEINGGEQSENVIRNNLIENNSQSAPGKHPGIALYASVEDARAYTLIDNVIRDTQQTPTQWIGIEERPGERRGRTNVADENTIRGNLLSGHKVADIVISGANTRCEDNNEAKVLRKLPQ